MISRIPKQCVVLASFEGSHDSEVQFRRWDRIALNAMLEPKMWSGVKLTPLVLENWLLSALVRAIVNASLAKPRIGRFLRSSKEFVVEALVFLIQLIVSFSRRCRLSW